MEWNPSRWITHVGKSETTAAGEELITPARGSYIAWSDGLRPCPGKKFSQVELVGTMVSLFGKYRVEIVPNDGETAEEARERVKRVVDDNIMMLLLQMREPKTVGLRWVVAE